MQIQLRKKEGATAEEPAHLVRSKTKQGRNAIVFDVIDGWTMGKTKKAAIAKTTANGGEMKKEAAVLKKVGDYICRERALTRASGRSASCIRPRSIKRQALDHYAGRDQGEPSYVRTGGDSGGC